MSSNRELLKRLSTFEGVYCSGFFIPDQSTVTALCLLFERVHFLNELEFAIEFSKRYRFVIPKDLKVPKAKLSPLDPKATNDPLGGLTKEQRRTVHTYLFMSDSFFVKNALLFPKVFHCSLLPNSKVFTATLVKEGKDGELNTYKVRKNDLVVSMDGLSELANHIDVGRIPILSTTGTFAPISNQPMIDPRGIAASLAISAVAMSLPATKAANETEILEAREKLRDHLPPFWAAMLKLSADLAKKLGANASAKDVQREVSASVNTIVRPALIELLRKLDLEKKDRFKNILRSAAGAMRVLAGKPPTDLAGLVSGSIMAGTDVALDFADQLRKIENLKRESGLTYLIEAAKTFRGQT